MEKGMRFKAIRLVVDTARGPHGYEFAFGPMLTIVRANNSTGKSTFFHTLLYALGMEELAGARGTRALQSAVREYFLDGEEKVAVDGSTVMLEMENKAGRVVTLRRAIVSGSRSEKLVEVFEGACLTGPMGLGEATPYYLHDAGSAQYAAGFFRFLELFLQLELPQVAKATGGETKLYLQDVFAAHAVEQKRGWTDYIGNAPFFGIRDVRTRVTEYVLGLDVFETAVKRSRLEQAAQVIELEWESEARTLRQEAAELGAVPRDLSPRAVYPFDAEAVSVVKQLESGVVTSNEYLSQLKGEYLALTAEAEQQTAPASEALLKELADTEAEAQRLVLLQQRGALSTRNQVGAIEDYRRLVAELDVDIEKNESARKLRVLGAQFELDVASGICPTCHQDIADTLLLESVSGQQMGIDANISYLKAQRGMLERQIDGLTLEHDEGQTLLSGIERELVTVRAHLTALRSDLGAGSLQAKSHLRRLVATEFELGRVRRFEEFFEAHLDVFNTLAMRFLENRTALRKLPKEHLSERDLKTIDIFSKFFRGNAGSFDYKSVQPSEINVSTQTLMPTLGDLELRQINARTNSSASDFVRLIWAYLIALYQTSEFNGVSGHHLGCLLFDEPAQHSMSEMSLRALFQKLSGEKGLQSIVAASFEDQETNFRFVTENVVHTLVTWEGKLIQPLLTRSLLDV
jgi:hypothetical protein